MKEILDSQIQTLFREQAALDERKKLLFEELCTLLTENTPVKEWCHFKDNCLTGFFPSEYFDLALELVILAQESHFEVTCDQESRFDVKFTMSSGPLSSIQDLVDYLQVGFLEVVKQFLQKNKPQPEPLLDSVMRATSMGTRPYIPRQFLVEGAVHMHDDKPFKVFQGPNGLDLYKDLEDPAWLAWVEKYNIGSTTQLSDGNWYWSFDQDENADRQGVCASPEAALSFLLYHVDILDNW